jgi:hypothetical protein
MFACDPGNIMNRGPEEYYTSSPYQLPEHAHIEKVEWEAEVPPKTWIKAQIRSAATVEALASASWQGAEGMATWLENGQPIRQIKSDGRWVQYRLALGAINSGNTPRLSEVRVHYAIEG